MLRCPEGPNRHRGIDGDVAHREWWPTRRDFLQDFMIKHVKAVDPGSKEVKMGSSGYRHTANSMDLPIPAE